MMVKIATPKVVISLIKMINKCTEVSIFPNKHNIDVVSPVFSAKEEVLKRYRRHIRSH